MSGIVLGARDILVNSAITAPALVELVVQQKKQQLLSVPEKSWVLFNCVFNRVTWLILGEN